MSRESERAISLARYRPSYPYLSKIWFGFQITTLSFRNHSWPASQARVYFIFPVSLVVRASSLPCINFQLPGRFSSLVTDSLDDYSPLSSSGRSLFLCSDNTQYLLEQCGFLHIM
jgi:hypothetical protein